MDAGTFAVAHGYLVRIFRCLEDSRPAQVYVSLIAP